MTICVKLTNHRTGGLLPDVHEAPDVRVSHQGGEAAPQVRADRRAA